MSDYAGLARRECPDEGVKFDGDKLRMDLIPVEAITGLAEVLTFGARKYGDRNWEKGMDWSRLYAATLRHLFSWWSYGPEDESGYSHIKHALTDIAMLVAYEERNAGTDNRPSKKRDNDMDEGTGLDRCDELIRRIDDILDKIVRRTRPIGADDPDYLPPDGRGLRGLEDNALGAGDLQEELDFSLGGDSDDTHVACGDSGRVN